MGSALSVLWDVQRVGVGNSAPPVSKDILRYHIMSLYAVYTVVKVVSNAH